MERYPSGQYDLGRCLQTSQILGPSDLSGFEAVQIIFFTRHACSPKGEERRPYDFSLPFFEELCTLLQRSPMLPGPAPRPNDYACAVILRLMSARVRALRPGAVVIHTPLSRVGLRYVSMDPKPGLSVAVGQRWK